MELQTVGEVVRTLRIRRSLEQIELAQSCGWRDASAVSRIETDRVRPTRRTLDKLANGLADPNVPSSAACIRALLFLASGIPPTALEAETMSASFPRIEEWPWPAAVVDFSWYLWRANDSIRTLLGIDIEYRGRHLLELMCDPNGGVRRHFGERWPEVVSRAAQTFQLDTAGRQDERWYRLFMRRMDRYPGAVELLTSQAQTPSVTNHVVRHRWSIGDTTGSWGVMALPLSDDPRFRTLYVLPESRDGIRWLQQAAVPERV